MSSRVFWGFLLVLVGGLFLLSNLGVLDWGVWDSIWRAWPIILVLWGVSVLLRPTGRLGAALTAVIAVLAVVGVLAFAYNAHLRAGEGGGYGPGEITLAQPLDAGIKNVRLSLTFGAGEIRLDGQAAPSQLASGTLGFIAKEPTVTYSASGEAADLRIDMASGTWTGSVGPRGPVWNISLNPAPTYSLDLDSGACSAELDLSALRVTSFDLSTGASDTRITFGDPGQNATAELKYGAASATIRVPRSVGVKVRMSSALVGSNLRAQGFAQSGQTWTSSGYDTKTSHLDIGVSAGVASFDIEWID
jgi:hypothetical protein